MAEAFEDTVRAVTQILGLAPPVRPDVFRAGTRLTGRYTNPEFDAHVPAMADHVVVAQFATSGYSTSAFDGVRRDFAVVAGTITFVPRGHEREVHTPETEVSNVFLSHQLLAEAANQIGRGRVPDLIDRHMFEDPKLFTLLHLLSQEVENGDAASLLFIDQLLDLVCVQLLRGHSTFSLPDPRAPAGLPKWQVKRVIDYMNANLGHDIALQELASLCGLSRFHFCRAFRSATGVTPHQWLVQLRMTKAREMLAQSNLSVTDIALSMGYQTPSAFTTAFRKVVGTSPQGFRRSLLH